MWRLKKPSCDAFQILPERLPLQFFVPDIRALEERNQQALGLHENRLWCPDLGIHSTVS
jgi:hypothetical protein